jgi:O-antigen/teichoic acid export membrane protein
MKSRPHSSDSVSLVRNTGYNLLAQGVNVVLALWAIPVLIKGLGSEQFGLLALLWAVVGYFGFLDFGISRANTKFLAESLALSDQEEAVKIVWTSLSSTFVLGIISGAILLCGTSFFVDHILKISAAMRTEAMRFFLIACIGIPFMLIFGTLKGFQMALHRFDIVNIFQTVMGVVQWGGSIALLWMGFGFMEIVLLTIGIRIVLAVAAFVNLHWVLPDVFSSIQWWSRPVLKKLLTFGGWVTLSQVISPLFIYIDRVFIGAFFSLSAVAYYAVPQEALTRVLLVPLSLTTVLFPVMSQKSILTGEQQNLGLFYYRSVKYLAIVMLPLILGFLLFSPDIINLWLGKEFAANSILVFQILTVGLFFNSLAPIPATMLHALNHPELTAKYHMIELPVCIALNLILIPWMGIVGAAIAWSVRVILDAILLYDGTRRQLKQIDNGIKAASMGKVSYLLIPVLAGFIGSIFLVTNIKIKIIEAVVFAFVYLAATWYQSFDDVDRKFIGELRIRLFSQRIG